MKKPANLKELTYVWKDRKRTFLGLPWSFTRYRLTEEKLYIETGFFTTRQSEVRLFRILDFGVTRTLGQKMFGLGTITCTSMDKSDPTFEIKNIKYPNEVKELISDLCSKDRQNKGVSTRENFFSDDDDDPLDDDND